MLYTLPHPQTSSRLRPGPVQASGMRDVNVCPDPGLRRDNGEFAQFALALRQSNFALEGGLW